MTVSRRIRAGLFAVVAAAVLMLSADQPVAQGVAFRFLVSGDARNCGDVVMPGIAAIAKKNQVSFYWHLGDFRAGGNVDEDLAHQPDYVARPMTVSQYLNGAWPDFIKSQIDPFGSIPFLVGIGNHELVAPKERDDFLIQFADWLNTPVLRNQRLADNPADHRLKTYYHWIQRGVDFIFIDNASNDMVDAAQFRWLTGVLARASANPAITTIVIGMHKALPDGYNTHSMDESPVGIDSGRRIYAELLKAQNTGKKKVYVLASHQHFYMETPYDTPYWREHGGVLTGYVVGTAGAQRYALPKPSPAVAITNVYGALQGTVRANGEIDFAFQEVKEADTPASVVGVYGKEFVNWCFTKNSSAPQNP